MSSMSLFSELLGERLSGDQVRNLIAYNPHSLKTLDSLGRLPIHVSIATHQSAEVIIEIARAYPEGVSVIDYSGSTPLCKMCQINSSHQSSIQVVSVLVDIYPEALSFADKGGYTPLHHALSCGASLEIIEFLIDRCPASLHVSTVVQENLPIHLACKFSRFEVIPQLVALSPDSLKCKTSYGSLPMHMCVKNTPDSGIALKTILHLACACPESLETTDFSGFLPIHYLCAKSRSDYVYKAILPLVDLYPDCLTKGCSNKGLPIHIVCSIYGCPSVLIMEIASRNPATLLISDINGRIPLVSYLKTNDILCSKTEYVVRKFINLCHVSANKVIEQIPMLFLNRGDESISIIRMILIHCDKNLMSQDKLKLYRNLNWKARHLSISLFVKLRNL